jgi:hypothetical protein
MFTRAKSALADVQVVFERHKTFISISATVLSSRMLTMLPSAAWMKLFVLLSVFSHLHGVIEA